MLLGRLSGFGGRLMGKERESGGRLCCMRVGGSSYHGFSSFHFIFSLLLLWMWVGGGAGGAIRGNQGCLRFSSPAKRNGEVLGELIAKVGWGVGI